MRIAIDCRWFKISNIDTVGGYTLNLVKALAELDSSNEYVLLFDRPDRQRYFYSQIREGEDEIPANLKFEIIFSSDAIGRNSLFLPGWLSSRKIDLFHSPYFLTQPFMKKYPVVITLHDLLHYSFSGYVNTLCPKQRFFLLSDFLQQAILGKADKIIVHGEELKKSLLDKFGKIKKEAVQIIPPGVEDRFLKQPISAEKLKVYLQKYELEPGYILFRGNQTSHMNLTTLINAYYLLSPELKKKHKLVITGVRVGEYHEKLVKLVLQLNLQGQVVFTGFISRRDLPYIYQGAALFVYPAFYETYGMMVIEALASGLPIICSDLPYLASLTNKAASLVNPSDTKALGTQIKNVLENPALRQELAEKSKLQSKNFSWLKTGREVLNLYQELC